MEDPLKPISEQIIRHPALRLELIKRLEKDLQHSFLDPSDDLAHIFQKLSSLIEEKPDKMGEWLYRVDVEEQRLPHLSSGTFEATQLALVILQRELQKVIFRRQYRS